MNESSESLKASLAKDHEGNLHYLKDDIGHTGSLEVGSEQMIQGSR